MSLTNQPAERAVLSGLCRYGQETYFDVCDMLTDSSFTNDVNRDIFTCLKHIFQKEEMRHVDVPAILSSAKELGIEHVFQRQVNSQHLKGIMDFPVNEKNVRAFAAKIRKLEVARLLHGQLEDAQDKLNNIKGDEAISHILGIAENSIFDFSSLLIENNDGPKLIGEGLVDYIKFLGENPVDQIGIPTGFPLYDKQIGGGLRPGTLNVIAARPKSGKTLLTDNIGYFIANNKIPVLNLDTEMSIVDHQHRLLACLTESYIYDVETGQFSRKAGQTAKIMQAASKLQDDKIPYYHLSIAGMAFEEQLATIRRWIIKNVGLRADGKANPCVIMYDYLKLMSTESMNGDLKEFQVLGFMMTSLHNFAVRYGVPMMIFMQLNRDGINGEGTDTASGSDRIIWLCSNYSIFKQKDEEEIAEDGPENGNRKLIPVVARHGSGSLGNKDYINCHMRGEIAKIVEGKSQSFNRVNKKKHDNGFVVETNTEADIPFK